MKPLPTPEARRLLLTAPTSDIAYLHAIVEGYDDLAVMRTISPAEGLVEVHVSPGREREFNALVAALRGEGIALELIPDESRPAHGGRR